MPESIPIEPLINDNFIGEPSKRTLAYIQSKREQNMPVIGTYCGFAPLEIFRAAGCVPAVLCAFSNKTIEAAEKVLPSNLCPLIKSSYGFIATDACPFYALSDAVVAETTCDGKKKMFELIAGKKPMYVMDLPQMPEELQAKENWANVIKNLKKFIEKTFDVEFGDEKIEEEIRDTNLKNHEINKLFDYAAMKPSYISWKEIYDLTYLAQSASYKDLKPVFDECINKLEFRKDNSIGIGSPNSPRVLVTGCPVGGDAWKVFKIIEESGGVIVAIDNCTGFKPFMDSIDENSADPYLALSKRYMNLHCSCMSPNSRRYTVLDGLIDKFSPDVVIDVVLHACHTYNIESLKVGEHVKSKHGLPFLKIETDFSESDVKQIKTRVEAMFEMME